MLSVTPLGFLSPRRLFPYPSHHPETPRNSPLILPATRFVLRVSFHGPSGPHSLHSLVSPSYPLFSRRITVTPPSAVPSGDGTTGDGRADIGNERPKDCIRSVSLVTRLFPVVFFLIIPLVHFRYALVSLGWNGMIRGVSTETDMETEVGHRQDSYDIALGPNQPSLVHIIPHHRLRLFSSSSGGPEGDE